MPKRIEELFTRIRTDNVSYENDRQLIDEALAEYNGFAGQVSDLVKERDEAKNKYETLRDRLVEQMFNPSASSASGDMDDTPEPPKDPEPEKFLSFEELLHKK